MKRLLVLLLALVGIVAGGCIIQSSTLYKDGDGRTHFVGLASNLSKVDVVSAAVEVKFFDSSNNLLATEWASPCTRTLQKNQSSPVESIIPAGVTASRTETVVHPMTYGAKTVPDLDIDNQELVVSDDITHLTGEVKNNDDVTFYGVQACVAYFDDDGDVVRVGRAYIDPAKLPAGDTGTFDIAVEGSPSDFAEYQLWVDATTRTPTDVTAPVVVGPDDLPGEGTPSTGALNPTANQAVAADGNGNGFETDPNEAYTSDDDYAVNEDNDGDPGDSHLYYDYGIDIPAAADIVGIKVRADWLLDATAGSNSIDVRLSWDGGTTWTDAKSDDEETTTEHSVSLGAADDDWGRDWTIDELSNANFRVKITCNSSDVREFDLDWIPVTIYYTE
jgi:hypothetical protein